MGNALYVACSGNARSGWRLHDNAFTLPDRHSRTKAVPESQSAMNYAVPEIAFMV
jgi:hypothetical protein